MKQIKNYTGQVFGRLTVLEFVERKNNISYWKCKCSCGNEIVIPIKYLVCGDTKSCGCIRKEKVSKLAKSKSYKKNKTLYSRWSNMKQRCYNKNCMAYKHYGARGIVVCDEWKNNYKNFEKWALNNGYKKNLTIDRINVNGNYEPNNCRWATIKEQNNNMTTNHYVVYDDEKLTLKQFSEKYNIDYYIIKNRIKSKWDIEKIIKTPVKHININRLLTGGVK